MPYQHRTSPSPRRSRVLILASCLLIGISGFVFGIAAILSSSSASYRCSNSEPGSVRVVWERGGGGRIDNGIGDGDPKRHRVMGFVGIQTGFGSVGRRRSLRQTWMPSDRQGLKRLEEATGLAFRFIVGRTNDKSKMLALQKEVEEYDDFVLLDVEEEYSKLPYKTLAFFKAAYALFDSEFYVKADDDIYLRPDRLSLLLAKERTHSQTYIGCMKKGPVFTDPKLKWYEPLSYLLGMEYFLHAYGPIYALSADVVASLVALRNNSFRMFSNEDVTIGAWMLAMNVNLENNKALCEPECTQTSIVYCFLHLVQCYSFRMFSNEDVTIGAWMLAMNVNLENNKALCEPECTQTSIAVWDIPKCSGLCNPEKKLLELHQKESCSKSPTLASDD